MGGFRETLIDPVIAVIGWVGHFETFNKRF